jgi:hypothetical protein
LVIRNISLIKNIKALKGSEIHYRIINGDYWIGLIVDKKDIHFARVFHRKGIYRYFL